jgi:hypothetical protein
MRKRMPVKSCMSIARAPRKGEEKNEIRGDRGRTLTPGYGN